MCMFGYKVYRLGKCYVRNTPENFENLAPTIHCQKTQFHSLYYLKELVVLVISGTPAGLSDFVPRMFPLNWPEFYLLC